MLNVLRSWLALVPWQRHELLSEEPFDLRPVRLADGAEKYFVIVRARILVDYYVPNFKGGTSSDWLFSLLSSSLLLPRIRVEG
jgi:hypothetical protein